MNASERVPDDVSTPGKPAGRSIAVPSNGQLWSNGIIPFVIDASVPASSRVAIDSAIARWNDIGGISLLPLAQVRRQSGESVQDSVRFVVGDYCASWVGRRGGEQKLWVAPHCPTGSVMHEIGHLLGLEHEHTRPDRDQHIKIHWENIEPDKRHNFDPAPSASRLPGSYDVDSIMHYGSHNFSSNGKPTLTLLDGSVSGIGQRRGPSEGDLQAIADLYGSDLSLVARTAASDAGVELDIYVSNETDRGAHDISVEVNLGQPGVIVDPTNERWSCVHPESDRMSCTAYILPGGAVEHLIISLPDAQDQVDIGVWLDSKTPDSDASNNLSQVASDEVREPPARQPAPQVVAALGRKTLAQDDAVAHVGVGTGALNPVSLLGLCLLLVGQAGRRV